MKSNSVSFAVQDDGTKTEWRDRMDFRKDLSAVLFDSHEGFIKTAVGIKVEQRSAFRRSCVHVLHERTSD